MPLHFLFLDSLAAGKSEGSMSAKSPDKVDGEVGARIRELRTTAGLSQTVLAEEVGVAFQQVQGQKRTESLARAMRHKAIGARPRSPSLAYRAVGRDLTAC
jgi:ribosome-binding protein aMBF1 (putative translation factor)